jgi:hypothetical protein
MLMQVLALTPEQISGLPESEKAAIMQLVSGVTAVKFLEWHSDARFTSLINSGVNLAR